MRVLVIGSGGVAGYFSGMLDSLPADTKSSMLIDLQRGRRL